MAPADAVRHTPLMTATGPRWGARLAGAAASATIAVGVIVLADLLLGDGDLDWGRAGVFWVFLVPLYLTEPWWQRRLRRLFGTTDDAGQRKPNSPAGDQGPPR